VVSRLATASRNILPASGKCARDLLVSPRGSPPAPVDLWCYSALVSVSVFGMRYLKFPAMVQKGRGVSGGVTLRGIIHKL